MLAWLSDWSEVPLTVSCFGKIQIGFTFLVLALPGIPGHRAIKRVCVCYRDHPGELVPERKNQSGFYWSSASTPPLSFYRLDALPAAEPTASKHWRQTIIASANRHWRLWLDCSTHRGVNPFSHPHCVAGIYSEILMTAVPCLLQITLRRYFDLSNPSVQLQPLAVSKVSCLLHLLMMFDLPGVPGFMGVCT